MKKKSLDDFIFFDKETVGDLYSSAKEFIHNIEILLKND